MIKLFTFLSLKWLVVIVLILFGMLIPFLAFGEQEGLFYDTFDDYNLGVLNEQGGWTGSTAFQVVDDITQDGPQSAYITNSSSCYSIRKDGAIGKTTGIQSSYFYFDGTMSGITIHTWIYLTPEIPPGGNFGYCGFKYNSGTLKWEFSYYLPDPPSLVVIDDDVSVDTWHSVQMEFDSNNWEFRVKLDSNAWSDWIDFAYVPPEERTDMLGQRILVQGMKLWWDTMGGEISAEPYIEGTLPESGSTITDLDDEITINFYNIDPEIYQGLLVGFKDDKLEVFSDTYDFDELENGTGQFTIPLSTFNFDSNRKWWLRGIAYGSHLDIQGGMFLTTRGWIDFFTDDLVIDPYYLLLDIEGLPTEYIFTDPEDWYGTNVERFDAPTQLFISFVGLLSPVFEKVGDFGVRVQGMFDQDEAYDRGYGLGEIFPLLNGYIQKIDQFFGGFPLVSFFKYLILVMLAIFVIRVVMKFIPFFG